MLYTHLLKLGLDLAAQRKLELAGLFTRTVKA
jgi:hypothetical protein